MTGDLLINGIDAATMGVSMGKGFIDTIEAPIELKPFIENESRLSHGKSVIVSNVKYASREISLTFRVVGNTSSAMETNRASLLALFYDADITIKIKNRNEFYHLRYLGKNATHSRSVTGRSCKISAKFSEDNPHERDGVMLDKTSLNLAVGSTYTLSATILPASGSITISWGSNNTSVATVNSSGKVTAAGVGSAIITATTSTNRKAICKVAVTQANS